MHTPWHHRPVVVLALLVVFPPAGIFLMWKGLPWTRNTKVGLTAVSGAWFVLMVVLSNADKSKEAKPAPLAASTATPKAIRPVPVAPLPTSAPPEGAALIDKQPLLLIPTKLDGFVLSSAAALPSKVGVGASASYVGDNKKLTASLNVNKSDVKPYPADAQRKPVKIGDHDHDHDGFITDNTEDKTISIEWLAGGWFLLVSVDYQPSERAAARKAVIAIAPQVSSLLDLYVSNKPPAETDRDKHLVEIAHAASTTKVHEFVSRIESVGITNDVVRNAKLAGSPDELIVVVGETWHQSIKQERLIAAQNMWKLWSGINSPTDPDKSRIKIVDVNGNAVGGSGAVAGSSVSVSD